MSSRPGPTRSRPTPVAPSGGFEVLIVCQANRCRSPAIVSVLDQGVPGYPGLGAGGVRLVSAGVSTEAGVPVDARTQKALGQAGYAPPDSVSRSVSPEMIASADLILTASRRHRTAIVRMAPDALGRTYTVREFARYCALLATHPAASAPRSPAARLRAAVSRVAEQRGMSFPARLEDDDIPDPAGRFQWAHARVVRLVVSSARPILAVAFDRSAATTR